MQSTTVLGLDISKLSASYWLLDQIPEDPKHLARKKVENKIQVGVEGRDKLLSLDFDFAVLEPTGVYSRIWRHWLKQAGRPYKLVGHQELASYRQGWKLQKTDKLDCLAMAMYGLERQNRASSFLIEKDYRLSDLVLFLAHLNEQKNGFQNNLRQKLAWQLPEWHSRRMYRAWGNGVPGMLTAVSGKPTPKWEKEIKESCGMGLTQEAGSLARILIQVEIEEIECEEWIDAELEKPQYREYLKAVENCGFSKWLGACLIAAVYPFEQFLNSNGKRRIIHTLSKENQKRVYKDESLRAFKLACGCGLIWVQSGDFEGWVAGGSGKTRENLRNSIQSYYLQYKKAQKNDQETDRAELGLIKNKFDDRGMMKVARRWVESFYKELVKEFDA